jgi:hypothetical protein
VLERLRQAHRGVRGGVQGGGVPRARVRGKRPRKKKFYLRKRVMYLGGFSAHGFFRCFSISS